MNNPMWPGWKTSCMAQQKWYPKDRMMGFVPKCPNALLYYPYLLSQHATPRYRILARNGVTVGFAYLIPNQLSLVASHRPKIYYPISLTPMRICTV